MRQLMSAAAVSIGVTACTWQGPSLAGLPGAQYPVTSYYANNAIEKSMSCTAPAMTPVRAAVVSDDGQQVAVRVRYHWYPNSQDGRSVVKPGEGSSSSNRGFCNGSDERTFTLARNGDGTFTVVRMTGPQRGHPAAG